jgi:hypothetical protein
LFASNPWILIRGKVSETCPAPARAEALAYVEQAEDFYQAASVASVAAARPLLQYYCYMNLAKAFILTRGCQATLVKCKHGISEQLDPGGIELVDAYLQAFRSPTHGNNMNLFDEFLGAIAGTRLATDKRYDLMKLIPQILPGHRLWAEAVDTVERFMALDDVKFAEDVSRKEIWLNLYVFEEDLSRLGVTCVRLRREARIDSEYGHVSIGRTRSGRTLVCLEQKAPTRYSGRAADKLLDLASGARRYLWMTVASIPPYRRYYLYMAPQAEHDQILPQLLSVYALTYYLGSITRYRPHHFDVIASGPYGARVLDFIGSQPPQFIYMMASEFARQQVTKPSIV